MLVSADVARASAEAVVDFVGAAGPTVLEPYCEEIAKACLERLTSTSDWRLNDLILQILFTMSHVDAYVRTFMVPTVETIIAHLEGLRRPGEPWPAVLPAFAILARTSVLDRIATHPELRQRTVVQTKRHFANGVIISRLHADLPLAILRLLDPSAPERKTLAEQAILETRVQSSESIPVLRKLVDRGQITDIDLLSKIAAAAANIISWRGDAGEMAMSVASSPHLIYDLARTKIPSDLLKELWEAVRTVLEECKASPERVFISEKDDENRVALANWITALLVLADRIGEWETGDALAASVAVNSTWTAAAVLLGRINTRLGRIPIAKTLGSADEFYAALPYHLAEAQDCTPEEIRSLLEATLKYGPRLADVGVFVLVVATAVPETLFDLKKEVALDYRWRLESMESPLQDILRPLLSKLSPTAD